MGTKSVRLDEAVYERVKAHKREEETFSEAIDRLLGEWSLTEFGGDRSEEAIEAHRERIAASERAGVDEYDAVLADDEE